MRGNEIPNFDSSGETAAISGTEFHFAGTVCRNEIRSLTRLARRRRFSGARFHSAGAVCGNEIAEFDSSVETAAVTGVDSDTYLVDGIGASDEALTEVAFVRAVTGITISRRTDFADAGAEQSTKQPMLRGAEDDRTQIGRIPTTSLDTSRFQKSADALE